jgi:hypothetical protein
MISSSLIENMPDHPEHWGATNDRAIRDVVRYAFKNRLVAAVSRAVPRGRMWLWGQVLDVREGGSRRYLTLLDSKNDNAWIDASVPRSTPVADHRRHGHGRWTSGVL